MGRKKRHNTWGGHNGSVEGTSGDVSATACSHTRSGNSSSQNHARAADATTASARVIENIGGMPRTISKSSKKHGSCGDTDRDDEININNSSRRSSRSRKSTNGISDIFLSDTLLRELVFEDFSRASPWEMLQHELFVTIGRFPVVAARRRYLRQIAVANARQTVPECGVSHTGAGTHISEESHGSWHACAVPPLQFSCRCLSPKQQQEQRRCAISLQQFAPLVLQTVLCTAQHPKHALDLSQTEQRQLLRVTYTCAAPLPDLCCTCIDKNSSDAARHSTPEEQRFAEDHGISRSALVSKLYNSSGDEELRCGTCAACILRWEQLFPSRASFVQRNFGVSEFLLVEAIRQSVSTATEEKHGTAVATGASTDSLRVPKHTAKATLAALGLASRTAQYCPQDCTEDQVDQIQLYQTLKRLPMFFLYSPQHEDCIGSQVLQFQRNRNPTHAVISTAALPVATAGNSEQSEEEASSDPTKTGPLFIREYESRLLNSAFAFCDATSKLTSEATAILRLSVPSQNSSFFFRYLPSAEFLHLLLPLLGANMSSNMQNQEKHYVLSLLQRLAVATQYTYFLPSPWHHRWPSDHEDTHRTAALEFGSEDWWLEQSQSTCGKGNDGSSDCARINRSIISGWHEVAAGAAAPIAGSGSSVASSADTLLQLLLLQVSPLQDLHVIWCSPFRPLRDWCSSRRTRPLAAAFDCRLRLTLHQSVFGAYENFLECHNQKATTEQQLYSLCFLQSDEWRQRCGITSRIHQLSVLLIACSNNSSNNKAINQDPFVSLGPDIIQDVERSRSRHRQRFSMRSVGDKAASKRSRSNASPNDSSVCSGNNDSSDDSTTEETRAAAIEAKLQQLFRPMTRQQQLLIHEQQAKRLLLTGSNKCLQCSCCSSACSCCGLDLAFGLLWGSSSSSSFFAELALCAGEQQRLDLLQEFWRKVVMQLRWMWDRGLLLPRVVSGITAAVATACAASPADIVNESQPRSALAAGGGISCCPDGPAALPDFCCCSLQQLTQQLNCAVQQQRLQWLLQDKPEEQQQQPFESLRFVLPPPPGLADLHEPIIPILPPITESTLDMHTALYRERRNTVAVVRDIFKKHCESLLKLSNKETFRPECGTIWWQHCFAGLPCSVEQLLKQRQQLLLQREAARSAAAAAASSVANMADAVHQAARAATNAAITAAGTATSSSTEDARDEHAEEEQPFPNGDKRQRFFNCLVEGEVALHGLESLTAPDFLGQILRILVASLAERCRLACACVLVSSRSHESKRCKFTPGVVAACSGHSGTYSNDRCKGRFFPCHIPAMQAAADELQRHAVAHAVTTAAARSSDVAWVPPLALLAACMRCECMLSAGAGLCRVLGTDPAALAVVNRALQLLLHRLQQQRNAAETEGNTCTKEADEDSQKGGKVLEAECDILVPVLSCSEKRALQRVLHRSSGTAETSLDASSRSGVPPRDCVLPWPPFAEEYVFLLLPCVSDGVQQKQQQKWRFYCREQHGDRAFAVAQERCFQ